jgi:hypothetical protein
MLTPKQNKNYQLENIFSPRSPLDFLGFAVVGVIINLLSGADPLGFLGVGILFIYWLWLDRRWAKKLSQRLRFVVDKEPPKGAKGLTLHLYKLCFCYFTSCASSNSLEAKAHKPLLPG